MQGMEISGYSSYINENHWNSYEDIKSATKDVYRYQCHNQIEIYPILRKQEKTMSKVKEQMLREQEQEFELELSYAEWLRDNEEPYLEAELIEMEEDFINKSSTSENRIITHKPLNNTNYDPRIGA
jgi:hypothetical protein